MKIPFSPPDITEAIVITGKNSIDILSPFCYIKITYLGKFFNRSVI